jgi:hypothetical protein
MTRQTMTEAPTEAELAAAEAAAMEAINAQEPT